MRPKYKSASEHKDAIEAIIWAAPAPLSTRCIGDLYKMEPKRVAGFLKIMADEGRVHSIPSGLSNNGKAWRLGQAPKLEAKPEHEDGEKACNVLPVRRLITSTWAAIMRRDPLVAALFGAPRVSA